MFRRNQIMTIAIAMASMIASDVTSALEIEEIVVTAERREASVQDTPIAVSAYGEQQMEVLQIDNTIDLVNVVPNLFGGNNTGLGTANMYYMRGQGNDESIATFDPPVGTYVDDVYVTRQNANNFALFDVERIEVLRGPQGTLYGRNTTGGAIALIMKKPAEEFGGYAEVGMGRFSKRSFKASLDIPLTDTFLTKLSAYSVKDDGYLKNTAVNETFNDMDNKGVRLAMRSLISEDVTWDITIDASETSYANVRGALVGGDRVSTSRATVNAVLVGGGELKSNGYGNDVENVNFTSNLAIEGDNGVTNVIIGKRSMDQKFLLNFPNALSDDFFAIDNDGEHDMESLEVKWTGEFYGSTLTTGVFFMNEDNVTDFADYLDFGAFAGAPGDAVVNLANRILENGTDSKSVYAQADIPISGGTLTLGARWTDDEKSIGFSGSIDTQALIDAGVPTRLATSAWTPRIAYKQNISDDLMVYLSATKGFKSGGWNSRCTSGPACLSFNPESLWSYEAGLRGDFMDGRLRANLTLFHSDLKDLQTTSATPDGQFLTTNAGGINNTGVEAEITYLPTENVQVFFAMGFQDADYVDLPTGCVVPNTSFAAFDENCVKAWPKRTPDETYTLGITGEMEVGNGMTLRPYASYRLMGESVTATRQLGYNDSGEEVLNAGIALDSNQGWILKFECNNCTDNTYTTSQLFVPYYNPPRTVDASIRWNF